MRTPTMVQMLGANEAPLQMARETDRLRMSISQVTFQVMILVQVSVRVPVI